MAVTSLWSSCGAAECASMFGGDSAHTGVRHTAAPTTLSLKWAFHTGGPIVSSPVAANGLVYIGSSDNYIYAVDFRTGVLRWKFNAHGDVNSSPAVSGGTVFAVSLDGNLYALDAATGIEKWLFATLGERRHTAPGMDYAIPATEIMPDPWDLFLSSPAVVGDTVYFGSGDTYLYAINIANGSLRWKYKTDGVVHGSPAVEDGIVYIGSFDTFFYAIDASSGALVWKFKTGDDVHAHLMTGIPGSAAVANGVVYFGCRDANVYALESKTGRLHWKYPTGGSWVISTPSVLGKIVIFTTSDSLKFQALDAGTGSEDYSLPYGTYSFSSPSVADGHAFFGTFDGKLHIVDLGTRSYSGEFAVPEFTVNGPRYLSQEGKLKADVVWTGDTIDDTIVNLRSKIFSMGSILSTPEVLDGMVYFGSADGTLYALGK
jgi:eukaryotic-like serine/threonine-protein kinase